MVGYYFITGLKYFGSYLLPATKHDLKETQRKIMAKVSEAVTAIQVGNETLERSRVEILALIETLRNTDPDLSPEGVAALERFKALTGQFDDIAPPIVSGEVVETPAV